jgi:hypothetical protein
VERKPSEIVKRNFAVLPPEESKHGGVSDSVFKFQKVQHMQLIKSNSTQSMPKPLLKFQNYRFSQNTGHHYELIRLALNTVQELSGLKTSRITVERALRAALRYKGVSALKAAQIITHKQLEKLLANYLADQQKGHSGETHFEEIEDCLYVTLQLNEAALLS